MFFHIKNEDELKKKISARSKERSWNFKLVTVLKLVNNFFPNYWGGNPALQRCHWRGAQAFGQALLGIHPFIRRKSLLLRTLILCLGTQENLGRIKFLAVFRESLIFWTTTEKFSDCIWLVFFKNLMVQHWLCCKDQFRT